MSVINKRISAVAALLIVLAVAAMFRDQVVLNTGGSVPVGFYIAVDPANAEYVTFCLPPLPQGVRFDPALCHSAIPNSRPVIKRVVRVVNGAVHVRGDIPFALDSELFGALDPTLVRGWWRPLFVRN
ncbi:MAG: hypothetical protein OXF88_14430 [Rhodobacteraceae bacterium]|nr:hypothetical protein [Paracoccaceae bacterium]MCY4141158.1 hypothetical protein [Paracoccaceae bacterium]